jgi:hypothetical protein
MPAGRIRHDSLDGASRPLTQLVEMTQNPNRDPLLAQLACLTSDVLLQQFINASISLAGRFQFS